MRLLGAAAASALLLGSCSASSEPSGSVTLMLGQIPEAVVSEHPDSSDFYITVRDHEAITLTTGVPLNDAEDEVSARWNRHLAIQGTPKGESSDGLGFIQRPVSLVHLEDPVGGIEPWATEAGIGFDPNVPASEAGVRIDGRNFLVQKTDARFVTDALLEVDEGVFNGAAREGLDVWTGEPVAVQFVVSARDDWRFVSDSASVASEWRNGAPSLLEDSDLAAAAAALDGVEVIDATLIKSDFGADGDSFDPARLTVPFAIFGWGVAVNDDGPITAATYVFASEDAANEALPQLEDLWRDPPPEARRGNDAMRWDMNSIEVQGRTVLVTTSPVEGETTAYFNDFLLNGPPTMFRFHSG